MPEFWKSQTSLQLQDYVTVAFLTPALVPAQPCPQNPAVPVSSVTCGGTLATHAFGSASLCK